MAKDPTGLRGAARVANTPTNRGKASRDPADVLATARSRLTMALSAYSDSREDELDDLRFMAGSPDNQWQWPQDGLATRAAPLSPVGSFAIICASYLVPYA